MQSLQKSVKNLCCALHEGHVQHQSTAQPECVRGPWPFYCAVALWLSLLRQPFNFWTACTCWEKMCRGMAAIQGCVIIPETRVLVPNFSPSCQQQERQSHHWALNISLLLSLSLLCLKNPAHRALLGVAKSMLLMLLRNFKMSWLPRTS